MLKYSDVFIIDHHHKEIEVMVIYDFHKGSTPGMGPDPDMIEFEKAIDGTGTCILKKLTKKQREQIEEAIYEKESR